MDPRDQVGAAVSVLLPAGFAAAAPFLGELLAHLPIAVLAPGMYDTHTNFYDASNAGEVGKVLGLGWIALELSLALPTAPRLGVAGPEALRAGTPPLERPDALRGAEHAGVVAGFRSRVHRGD